MGEIHTEKIAQCGSSASRSYIGQYLSMRIDVLVIRSKLLLLSRDLRKFKTVLDRKAGIIQIVRRLFLSCLKA
jgi:hypothetical protein